MNKQLEELIMLYAKGDQKKLHSEIDGISKSTLASSFTDLLTMYFNDLNSSTLREFVTVTLAGYETTQEKLGYNGYRLLATRGKKFFCEAKPKNARLLASGKINDKLSGKGNFSDYTPERLRTDLKVNPQM
jgi:hypothetical protein